MNAGGSRSFTHVAWLALCCLANVRSSSSGSAVLRVAKLSALNTVGVGSPSAGLTRHIFVSSGSGGCSFRTISPRPVQYAAPVLKNTEMSDPMSPLHASKSASLAGRPHNSFAAHRAVAAFPLPPPRPAPAGTHFTKFAQKCCEETRCASAAWIRLEHLRGESCAPYLLEASLASEQVKGTQNEVGAIQRHPGCGAGQCIVQRTGACAHFQRVSEVDHLSACGGKRGSCECSLCSAGVRPHAHTHVEEGRQVVETILSASHNAQEQVNLGRESTRGRLDQSGVYLSQATSQGAHFGRRV